jgi:hypothetical protein
MKARKKLIAGLMAAMIVTTIGAVYATEQTDGTATTTPPQKIFREKQDLNRTMPFGCNLTAEQQTELQELLTTLQSQNATPQEIRTAIQEKLDEFGVFDAQLATQIAQTQQRLAILNREKELREQGYNWTETQTIIQDEFNLQNTTYGQGMMYQPGFGYEPRGRGFGFPSRGDQNMTGDGQHMRYGHNFGREPNGGCGDFNLSATTEK